MNSLIHWLETHLLRCPFKAVTGMDCPGCGTQRAFVALLKGNFLESLYLYPALIPTLFTLIFTGLHLIFKFRDGAAIIKYSYLSTISLALISYFIKMFS